MGKKFGMNNLKTKKTPDEMEQTFTADEVASVKKSMDIAEKDTTPIMLAQSSDNIQVFGDANKTEVKVNDYVVRFCMPHHMMPEVPAEANPETIYKNEKHIFFDIKFDDRMITPRMNLDLTACMIDVLPFFRELHDSGGMSKLTHEEVGLKIVMAGQTFHNAVYNLVTQLLDIDSEIADYIVPHSAIENMAFIIINHPELYNESDVFSG